ncbi:MAG: DnaJ domain-containing protein [Spirochaetota bacterium]
MRSAAPPCYSLLELEPGCSIADARAAYRRLAKRNHPDLAPDAERPRRQLQMMRINEAYMAVTADLTDAAGGATSCAADASGGSEHPSPRDQRRSADRRDAETQFTAAWARKTRPGVPSASTSVGALRDPAYAYYKQGFRYFNLGATELIRKEAPAMRRELLRKRTIEAYDAYVMRFVLRALHYFERSYSYFLVVAERYPASPWAADARWKLRRLEKFSAIYQRICENLSRRSSTRRSSLSTVNGAEPS